MTDPQKILWSGRWGTNYTYWIHSIGTTFEKAPANYIYATIGTKGWIAPYIGKTGDISQRTLDTHHKRDCIVRNGVTHIHVHKSSNDEEERQKEEADLVAKWNPPCNDRWRSVIWIQGGARPARRFQDGAQRVS